MYQCDACHKTYVFFHRERLLDKEYELYLKTQEDTFDFMKMATVMELRGELQEEYIGDAQSKLNNSRRTSLVTAFGVFQFSA